jgi:glycerol-3-phosphate dehydrogenase (NAD(P)+)
MLTKATVVGTGAMGTVLAQILSANSVNVSMLAASDERAEELIQRRENKRYLPGIRLHSRVSVTSNVAAAMASTELIISAIPCQYLRRAWERYGPSAPSDVPICSVTKGLELETMRRPSEIIAENAPDCPVAILSGPSIAHELARCLPATVVVASDSADVCELIQSTMSTSWFRIYTNADVLGVELGGAVKNVIAIAAGILDGLQAGDNAKSALVTRGLVEISRLAIALGARAETFVGLAGLGDLITTCISPHGRNRSAGERIGKGVSVDDVVSQSTSVIEGIPTTRSVLKLAEQRNVEMPITRAVYDVLFNNVEPLAAITGLMQRPPKAEEPH